MSASPAEDRAPGAPVSRPRHLRPLPPPPDHQIELPAQRSYDQYDRDDPRPYDHRPIPPPVRPPSLSLSEARLARWLTRYALQLTPKNEKQHRVDAETRSPGFHAATAFVLRFGGPLIFHALRELTYKDWVQELRRSHPDAQPEWTWVAVRFWSDEIVSPARRLASAVRDLDELSRNQQRGGTR